LVSDAFGLTNTPYIVPSRMPFSLQNVRFRVLFAFRLLCQTIVCLTFIASINMYGDVHDVTRKNYRYQTKQDFFSGMALQLTGCASSDGCLIEG
jgi:hypothetical protein